jgi:hypothetical protein
MNAMRYLKGFFFFASIQELKVVIWYLVQTAHDVNLFWVTLSIDAGCYVANLPLNNSLICYKVKLALGVFVIELSQCASGQMI